MAEETRYKPITFTAHNNTVTTVDSQAPALVHIGIYNGNFNLNFQVIMDKHLLNKTFLPPVYRPRVSSDVGSNNNLSQLLQFISFTLTHINAPHSLWCERNKKNCCDKTKIP